MKVNLASGQRPFPKPWINVDIRNQGYDIDIETDIKNLPFDDNSCDILVLHHVWEHIPLHEQEDYIREWWRVLRPGGFCSVSVPNMKEIARRWVNGEIDTFTFAVNASGPWQGYVTDLHRWQYDEQELKDRFSCWNGNERKFDWEIRDTNMSNPLYQGADISFDWWILNKEFHKPS